MNLGKTIYWWCTEQPGPVFKYGWYRVRITLCSPVCCFPTLSDFHLSTSGGNILSNVHLCIEHVDKMHFNNIQPALSIFAPRIQYPTPAMVMGFHVVPLVLGKNWCAAIAEVCNFMPKEKREIQWITAWQTGHYICHFLAARHQIHPKSLSTRSEVMPRQLYGDWGHALSLQSRN